jgi:hypothetical protein
VAPGCGCSVVCPFWRLRGELGASSSPRGLACLALLLRGIGVFGGSCTWRLRGAEPRLPWVAISCGASLHKPHPRFGRALPALENGPSLNAPGQPRLRRLESDNGKLWRAFLRRTLPPLQDPALFALPTLKKGTSLRALRLRRRRRSRSDNGKLRSIFVPGYPARQRRSMAGGRLTPTNFVNGECSFG